jgi:hypothetical protein
VTATFPDGAKSSTQGDVLAAFSLRGGPAQTLGVSKPDVPRRACRFWLAFFGGQVTR